MVPSSVKLEDRTLWFDGDSTIKPQNVIDALSRGLSVEGLFVEHLTDDIIEYNKFATPDKQIDVKTKINPLTHDWNIPIEYATLDIKTFLFTETSFDAHAADANVRCQRVLDELELYEELQLLGVLRVLIYIINRLTHNNVMWGVGRGSCVSSYVLYLIGVHDIDSVTYELDVCEFLRSVDPKESKL